MAHGHQAERAALLAVLGLPADAARPEIVRAFRRLARETHPDASADAEKEAAQQRFVELSDAYRRILESTSTTTAETTAEPHPVDPAVRQPELDREYQTFRRRSRRSRPPIVAGPVIIAPHRGTDAKGRAQ